MSDSPEERRNTEESSEDVTDELERALNLVGLGRYNLSYCIALMLVLIASVMEGVGITIILPVAKCDLKMSDRQRGYVLSIPFIGIFLTSYIHGYLVDTQGRKKMLIYTSFIAGCANVLSACMPNLITFSLCKFLTSLCISVPLIIPYTLIGEIVPAKYRDEILSLANAVQIAGSVLVTLIAWGIMTMDFRFDIGLCIFRPWRLLAITYASFFIVSSFLLRLGQESPKFLISQGNSDDALKVLQIMYAVNKRKRPEDFPIRSLLTLPSPVYSTIYESVKGHTLMLMHWRYVKYLLLNGALLFGVFFILNGIHLWSYDILDRIITHESEGKTACQVIKAHHEQVVGCKDSIDVLAFQITAASQFVFTLIGFGISCVVNFIGKKKLLITCFYMTGASSIVMNHTTCDVLTSVLISTYTILALACGPINAYTLQEFPTHIRGMAVCLSMMIGRMGSIIGSALTGTLINVVCTCMFYAFGVLLLACGTLTFLHK